MDNNDEARKLEPEQLAAIKARWDRTAPAPWYAGTTGEVYRHDKGPIHVASCLGSYPTALAIAHAREDVPTLLAHAEAETARADAAEAEVERLRDLVVTTIHSDRLERQLTVEISWLDLLLERGTPVEVVRERVLDAIDKAAAPEGTTDGK